MDEGAQIGLESTQKLEKLDEPTVRDWPSSLEKVQTEEMMVPPLDQAGHG